MQNGYFRLVTAPGGYGIELYAPREGGEPVRLAEVVHYLEQEKIACDINMLKGTIASGQERICFLARQECPRVDEYYRLEISKDGMMAVARFYPPSDTGNRISFAEMYRDLKAKGISTGIQMQVLQEHFQSDGYYCTDLLIAKGREPRHGTDARIEYFFNTDVHIQPTLREDGTVDYFHLNVINHCHKGDVLARIIPADEGDPGQDIFGKRIKSREVKTATLKYGNHIELAEDRMSISSQVDGHVMLVGDKVFVSDVYEVENVDLSTGNIEFEGSVQINGNVASNFRVVAKGNVEIRGVVEGAHIIAGGNIIIARGMSGMGKGTLKAGGNIVAKFMENLTAEAEGYVNTESILHSDVSAGTEIVVAGRKGLITGGHIQAGHRVVARTLGADLGEATIVEVGISPQVKAEYVTLQKEMAELIKEIRRLQPIIEDYNRKKARGALISSHQLLYIENTNELLAEKKQSLVQKNGAMQELQKVFEIKSNANVEVQGVVYQGTTIIIDDMSMVIQNSFKSSRFERVDAEVKAVPL